MIKNIRNTFRQTLVYSLSNILVKVVGFILMPIYLNNFSLEEYGTYGLLEVTAQFIVGVFAFNLPIAMLRLSSEDRSKRDTQKIYFTAWMSLLIIVGVFLAIGLPFSELWSRLVLNSAENGHYFVLLFVSAALEILGLLPLQLLRFKEKPGQYTLAFSVKFVAMLVLVYFFIDVKDMGIEGYLWASLLSNSLLVIATIPMQIKNSFPSFDRSLAKELFAYGLPLVLNTASVILLNILDKYILNEYFYLAAVGIYNAAYRIGSIVNFLLINSFSLGFLPMSFKLFKEPGFNRFFSRMLTYFTGVTIIFTLAVSIFSQEIIKLLSLSNPDFWRALIYVPLIAFGFIFKGIQFYLSLIFHLIKKTRYNAPITIFALVINTILNFWLIPKYDIMGAVVATGISYFLMMAITFFVAQSLYKIKYEGSRLAFLIVGSVVFIVAGYFLNDVESLIIRIPLKTATFLFFPLVFYFLLADRQEKEKIRKIWLLLKQPGGLKKTLTELKNPQ